MMNAYTASIVLLGTYFLVILVCILYHMYLKKREKTKIEKNCGI